MKPSIGRIVHVVLASGAHRPATVVNAFDNDRPNVAVFLDVTNDLGHSVHTEEGADIFPESSAAFVRIGGVAQLDSVPHDEDTKAPGTWHWPERE
ncbi:hypothetical protein GO986_08590 [Deinococcus sp. HMF7620]|uniref:Uncharacterized protein n=1 Tax=Deinococcus arboris TaxID=2682977 RepID=A0A7C9M8D1_9DEIO|nr:hypothetical protein [Deinococcus arboris]MVN86819.1 hypothetical protein [Deinococcus arboris]